MTPWFSSPRSSQRTPASAVDATVWILNLVILAIVLTADLGLRKVTPLRFMWSRPFWGRTLTLTHLIAGIELRISGQPRFRGNACHESATDCHHRCRRYPGREDLAVGVVADHVRLGELG
jgi:hypothetical protein